MIELLDPARLTPTASLNRQRLADLPGVELEPGIQGRLMYELLSADAAARVAREQEGLHWSRRDLETGRVPDALDAYLSSDDATISEAAEAVARRLGLRLGYLVLTLKRGDEANRVARADWDSSYWSLWSSIRRIWFGGGLMSGKLGAVMVAEAQQVVDVAGATCALARADHADSLPLIGASRSVPMGHKTALVVDFGGTAIKRAVAEYSDGRVLKLRRLPNVRSDIDLIMSLSESERPLILADRMAAVLAGSWQELADAGHDPAPFFACSIASYIRDNQPLARQGGIYSELLAVSDNFGHWLAVDLRSRLEREVAVELIHDGTAAARTYAGAEKSAVIMMGTALGVGFPGPSSGLMDLDASFQLENS